MTMSSTVLSNLVVLLTVSSLLLLQFTAVESRKERVKLKDVQTLTLHADSMTTSRRSPPVRQLTCVGGYCNRAKVRTAQCYNRGFDGQDVQWECKAEMPRNYKFGKLEVTCEGYDYPEDDYILAGSCGLEYTVDYVDDDASGYKTTSYGHQSKQWNSKTVAGASWFNVISIIGLMGVIYFFCLRDNNQHQRAYSSTDDDSGYPRPGGYGGSFSSGPSAPPPPPGFRTDFGDAGDSCSGGTRRSTTTGSGSSGPGFLSGLAAGGLMGYLFGSSGSNTRQRRSYFGSSYADTDYGYDQPSTSSSFFSSGGGGSSSGTSTSTGFASTRRR